MHHVVKEKRGSNDSLEKKMYAQLEENNLAREALMRMKIMLELRKRNSSRKVGLKLQQKSNVKLENLLKQHQIQCPFTSTVFAIFFFFLKPTTIFIHYVMYSCVRKVLY